MAMIIPRVFRLIHRNWWRAFLFFVTAISSIAGAQTDSVDIYEMDLMQLSKLKITSATKTVQRISEVSSSIRIIPAEEIKEKGAFTLEEALSDLPGFQFRNILGINSYVFLRGIPNQNNLILVLIDGVQINELNSGGFYAGAQYNLSNVERIEIIYGPSSVTYGTNALTGIINIVTKSAMEKKMALNTSIGTFQTSSGDFSYSTVNEEKTAGISVSGMWKSSAKANLKGGAGDNNWTDLMDNFEDDYAFDIKAQAGNFTVGTNIQYKQASTATSMKSTGTIYRDYGTSWNILFANAYIKSLQSFSEKLTLSSLLYNRNTTVLGNTVYYVVDTAQVGYYRPNNLIGIENVLNYSPVKTFSLAGGITLEYERIAEKNTNSYSSSPAHKPPEPGDPKMLRNSLVSIFIEPNLSVLNSLYLSGGIRVDQSSVYDQVFTPRAGMSYQYKKHIIRCSYAEAFRAPKPWDYSDGLGNKSLLPEELKSIETSVTVCVTDSCSIDLAGYRNALEKAIVKEVVPGGYRWVNSGEVTTSGIELGFRYVSSRARAEMNYTFTESYDEHHAVVPEISKHSGNASVTYSPGSSVRIHLHANYYGKRENPKIISATGGKDLGPFVVVHGSVSVMEYKGFHAQVSVRNIFDEVYYHTSNRDPDRYRQPQRTFMFSLGYTLKE